MSPGQVFPLLNNARYGPVICFAGVHGRCNCMQIPSESPEYNSFNALPMVIA